MKQLPPNWSGVVLSIITGMLLVAGLLIGFAGSAHSALAAGGTTLFAKPNGTGTSCTQSTPCALQTAVVQAANGDVIILSHGTYTSTGSSVVSITKSLSIYGGWDGNPTGSIVRNPRVYTTTIDGRYQHRGIFANGPITVTLDGFAVTNCKVEMENGGGLYTNITSLTLSRMLFTNNVVTNSNFIYGGGAYILGGTIHVTGTTFKRNASYGIHFSFGGGLAISNTVNAIVEKSTFLENDGWIASGLYFLWNKSTPLSPITIQDNLFSRNGKGLTGVLQGGYSGAFKIINAKGIIKRNLFQNNKAANDSGVCQIAYSEVLFDRNQFFNNQSGNTSAISFQMSKSFTFTNNILAGNRSTLFWRRNKLISLKYSSGIGIHNTLADNRSKTAIDLKNNSQFVLTDTIIVSHTTGISVSSGCTASLEATLWGTGTWKNNSDWDGPGTILTGTINLWGNPDFVNPPNNNWHIGVHSAAINAGIYAGIPTDIDGEPRLAGLPPEIGADEIWWKVYLPSNTK